MTAIPKPPSRYKASAREWQLIRDRFHREGFRECIHCSFRTDLELHHIVPRSQGGDDVIQNLVPLCQQCHRVLEDHATGWEHVAYAVRQFVWNRQSRLNYVTDKIGVERFDRRYPHPPHLALGDLARPRNMSELPK